MAMKLWLSLLIFGLSVNAILPLHPIVPIHAPTAPIAEAAANAVPWAMDLPKMILPKHKGSSLLNSISSDHSAFVSQLDPSSADDQSTQKEKGQNRLGDQELRAEEGKGISIQHPPSR